MTTATLTLRKSVGTTFLKRRVSTLTSTSKPTHHQDHARNHVYLKPTTFLGSFSQPEPPQTPKQALSRLALLRRDYAKQLKELRKQYIDEMEVQRLEKVRKNEARNLEVMKQREARRKEKAASAQARALELKAFDEDLRLTLMKEKTEKLEYWKLRQKKIADRKNSKKELICKQSSEWIDEKELEAKVLQAMVDSKVL